MNPQHMRADTRAQLQAQVDRELEIVDLEQAIANRTSRHR